MTSPANAGDDGAPAPDGRGADGPPGPRSALLPSSEPRSRRGSPGGFPDDFFVGAPEVTVDNDEILVVGPLERRGARGGSNR